ncbi:hypothetical protein PoB_006618400 [Plakobranchus ocellatus]|uniref:Uncharacterized protein n=1 Tax=Plakobranchus ocellatus TaxID=259542 RepID=A0AAV4D682_9GAST|nr:hypothetical protein PoB_006618400 [Plakobranchus ocellatus]
MPIRKLPLCLGLEASGLLLFQGATWLLQEPLGSAGMVNMALASGHLGRFLSPAPLSFFPPVFLLSLHLCQIKAHANVLYQILVSVSAWAEGDATKPGHTHDV